VSVRRSAYGGDIKPFTIPIVFGSPPKRPSGSLDDHADADRFKDEMREQIRNILRICHWHRHDQSNPIHEELIISASFKRLPARVVASLFREALLEHGDGNDCVGAFGRVTFALPQGEVPATVCYGFEEEFVSSPCGDLSRRAWAEDGQLILPKGFVGVCLDAYLENVHADKVNGAPVGLYEPVCSKGREHQQWIHTSCGRIVLAAFPRLCLNAKYLHDGADIHIWSWVEHWTETEEGEGSKRKDRLQIWEETAEGEIVLKHAPEFCLSVSIDANPKLQKLQLSKRGSSQCGTTCMWQRCKSVAGKEPEADFWG